MKIKAVIVLLFLALIGSSAFAVDVDGQLAQGEYTKQASFDKGNFNLYWKIVGDKIFMAIEAKASGWVAVGFEPTTVMANADMIFGFVDVSGPPRASTLGRRGCSVPIQPM